MPGFFHNLVAGLIKKQLPEYLEQYGKPEVKKLLAGMRADHEEKGTLDKFHEGLKALHGGLKWFEDAVDKSPNEYDNAGLAIFLEPIEEALLADGIQL